MVWGDMYCDRCLHPTYGQEVYFGDKGTAFCGNMQMVAKEERDWLWDSVPITKSA